MTDIRDIYSTRQTTKDIEGNNVITVRDSLLAECLLSIIMGITLLSCLVVLRSYIDIIDVSMYMQFVPLLMTVVHVLIRRTTIKSQFLIFILHVISDVLFFFAVTSIPVLQFGNSIANKVYLGAILIAFTLFSLFYRLKPAFTASDHEFIVFPAVIHIVFYLLYVVADQEKYSRNIIIHALIIAVLFIVMRQIAVFDAKFYHSIHKSSKPLSLLRKQNNKTIAGLLAIITVALLALTVFPIDWLSNILLTGIKVIGGFIVFLISAIAKFFKDDPTVTIPMQVAELSEQGGEINPYLEIFGRMLAFLFLTVVLILIINAVRILIRNAPRFKKEEVDESGAFTDTIEDIRPEKRSFTTKGLNFGTGHERRIRKQFYAKTRRAMKKGLPVSNSSTPGQIENVLLAGGDREISELRKEYEKVRYGKK